MRLQLEVLRIANDQVPQAADDFLPLRRRGERGDVIVQGGLQRLHPVPRVGVRGVGQERSQVARMGRDQRGDFAQVGTSALAPPQPHNPALFAAQHQVHRAVAVEVGEIHQRPVRQGVQVQLRKGGPGDAERAVRRQPRSGTGAGVDAEVDRAPVVGIYEIGHAVLVQVGNANVQVVGAFHGLPMRVHRGDGRVDDRRLLRGVL